MKLLAAKSFSWDVDFERTLEMVNSDLLAQVQRQLSEAEIAILAGAWHDQTYEQIAEVSGYSTNYLQRCAAPKFWKLLSQVLQRQLNKTNARAILLQLARQEQAKDAVHDAGQGQEQAGLGDRDVAKPPPEAQPEPLPTPRIDWGEAIDVSNFYGRDEELDTLTQWIVQHRCRLVTLLGMGGIGKSSLAARIGQQLQQQFDYVVWRSLRNAPPLEVLLKDLVPFLSHQQDTQPTPERLFYWLRASRCLLILDNLETILQPGDRAGNYQPGYENYGELFHLLGESFHQSCLILTSREKPAEIGMMESLDYWVRSLPLAGSPEASLALIQSKGLIGDSQQQQALCQRYGCSPLALKIVATSIRSLFDGEIAPFLEQETIVFNGLRRLLSQQFNRLTHLEKTIMYWLAINREWTSIAELTADIVPVVSRSGILEALESLHWRSLIEKRAGCYTLQPVVMEYATDSLIQQVSQELTNITVEQPPTSGELRTTPLLFQTHALIKTSARDAIRESQTRLILQPICDRLRTTFSSLAAIEQQILRILLLLRRKETELSGYGCGNLLNLCCQLNLDLTEYNFSRLTIRQAYLRQANLHRVNFSHAVFNQTVFIQTFGYVLSLALRPNGQVLAIGDGSGKVRLWRTSDGQPLDILQQGSTSWVWSLVWSPDGQVLASGGVDQVVRLWNPETGECLHTLVGHHNWVRSLAWSPDGSLLASGSTDRTVKLWNPQTGECLKTLEGQGDAVWSVAWSPDGALLVTGGIDQHVRIWDVAIGRCLHTLKGHTQWVRAVAWSPDGKTIASAGDDRDIRLWDATTQRCLAVLPGHQDAIWSLSWSPEGERLASASHDKTVKLWDVQEQTCFKSLSGHTNWVWGVEWSQDAQILVSVGHDRRIKIWDVPTWDCLRTVEGHTSVAMSVAWSPNGQYLAGSCDDQVVRLWDTSTGDCYQTLVGHENVVWDVTWRPDGQVLASSCDDCTVKLWDLATGQCLNTLEHGNWVWSVDWSPDGKYIASCTQDYVVVLWDAATGEQLQLLEGHHDSIWAVVWSPDGKRLASACDDHTVRIWDAATGRCLTVLTHDHSVRAVSWSADGKYLATGSADPVVRIWDSRSGTCVGELQGHQQSIWSIAWNPSAANCLASGGADATVRLWDTASGQCLHCLEGHTNQIWSIAWSPDGQTLASSSADKMIQLWDGATGEPMQRLRAPRPYEGMNITGVSGITDAQKESLKTLGAIAEGR